MKVSGCDSGACVEVEASELWVEIGVSGSRPWVVRATRDEWDAFVEAIRAGRIGPHALLLAKADQAAGRQQKRPMTQ